MSKLNRRSDHSSRWRSFDNFISSWRPATEENFQWKSWRDSSLAAIELKERIDSERSVARETASLRNPCFYSSRFAFLLLFHLYFTFYRFCFPRQFAFRFFFFFFFVYDSRILHSTILFFSFFFISSAVSVSLYIFRNKFFSFSLHSSFCLYMYIYIFFKAECINVWISNCLENDWKKYWILGNC